jgi:hypothetical protein
MTYDEARRRLERTTDFRFQGDRVWVRDVAILQAVAALRDEDDRHPAPALPSPLAWTVRRPSVRGQAA